MKKTILIILLFSSLARAQFWENPNQKPSMFGMRINRGHLLGDPVGYWPFNEGSGNKVYDLSGNGLTGTLVGTAHFEAGGFGSSIDLDGDSDYVDLGVPPALGIVKDQIAISIWSKSTSTGTQMLIGQGEDAGFSTTWFFRRQTADKLRFSLDTSVGSVGLTTAALGNTDDGNWHHAVATYDGANMRIYWDNVLVAGPSAQTGTIDASNGQKYFIGAADDDSGISKYLNGQIDIPMVYDRGFSTSEIALLYREPFCFMEPNWDLNLYFGMSFAPPGAGQFININMN